MTLKEIESKFILNDGEIISCLMNFDEIKFVSIILKVRENVGGKISDLKLEFKFYEIIECEIFENVDSKYYSDITLLQTENQDYYLSLDPYDNSNVPNENDNFIVKSKNLEILRKD